MILRKFVIQKDKMTTAAIRQKLYEYIRFADDKKVKAFYTIVADEAVENILWWEDEKLMEELKRSDAALDSGEEIGIPWSEVKNQILNNRVK